MDTVAPSPAEGAVAPRVLPRTWLSFSVLLIGGFLAILDVQIVAAALAPLSASLGATLEETAWAQSAYLLAEVIVIPLTGWLASTISTRYLFTIACGGFSVMSLFCALAWNLPSMIVFRTIQGLFGGLLIPIIFSSIFLMFPAHQQQRATILGGMVSVLAPSLGPVAGGFIVNATSWHWLFLINLPVALPATILGYYLINHDQPDFSKLKDIDLPGIALVAISLGSADFILKEGIRYDWFASDLICLMSVTAILSSIAFVWRELSYAHPVVDLRLFAVRNFSLGSSISFLSGILLFPAMYLIPAILTSIRDYDSLSIGLTLMISGVAAMCALIIFEPLSKYLSYRTMLTAGLILGGLSFLNDARMTADVSRETMALGQVLRSSATALLFMSSTLIAMSGIAAEKVGQASALFNLMRNLGGAIGISFVTWMVQMRFDLHFVRSSERVTEGRIANDNLADLLQNAPLLPSALPAQTGGDLAIPLLLKNLVTQEALVQAYADTWWILGWLVFAGLCAIPFIGKVERTATPPALH